MNVLSEIVKELNIYEPLKEALQEEGGVKVSGCVNADKAHFISSMVEGEGCVCIVTKDEISAEHLLEEYSYYHKKIVYYPAKDFIFYSADVHSNLIVEKRISALRQMMEDADGLVVVTTTDAFADSLISKEEFARFILPVQEGDTMDLDEFKSRMVNLGYERVPQVETSGQFAVRGGIIDIFPFTESSPVRIELWDDEVDSIRYFDVDSQRSIERITEITIYPATDMPLSEEGLRLGVEKILAEMEECEKTFKKAKNLEAAGRIRKVTLEQVETIQNRFDSHGAEKFIPYLCERPVTLLDYLPANTLMVLDEPQELEVAMKAVEEEFVESMGHRMELGYVLPGQVANFHPLREIAADFATHRYVAISTFDDPKGFLPYEKEFTLNVKSIGAYHNKFEILVKDLEKYLKKKYRVILATSSRTRAERLSRDLRDYDLPAAYVSGESGEFPELLPGQMMVIPAGVGSGYEYPELKFVVISERDIFTSRKLKRRKKHGYEGKVIATFSELVPGDYVVHEEYGLGIYRGIEKKNVGGVEKDWLAIEYRDGGVLYVLATQLGQLQKYAGPEGKVPKLNKIGGAEWGHTKEKVEKAVETVARDLVELYATRQMEEGFQFSPDNDWQMEFEEMFPYEETTDQITAIEATKKDMQSSKIMDRLICGDVGFGKTEVAIRAAFKAVQDGKQVVYLCPTTILAGQHFDTFAKRMKSYPVNVALLSRFRTGKQMKETLRGLEDGSVDIVIGTHRVLSKDVVFKNLGLLIVDEEQRFGVTHKEKIKKLRENVDVLTLSATPIPRTLHMSLVGIRDMSVLEEAPQDRRPIQTFVTEQDDELVREAIRRELARGGQVYYVYNRVQDIEDVAERVQALVPDAKVAVGHGQMDEHTLESVMYDFINHEVDILVSTTIIETGLDISNVNTMIIQDADKFGLSQLYQLRGRIGRSNRTAYCFLLYRRNKLITEVAQKRLEAIKEFSDLGSGFKIAMKDLEIRGAGNVLGQKQHGHMAAVGYDLYCKMLNEAVLTMKGEKKGLSVETLIDLEMDALIPSTYIRNEVQKLDIYKRINAIGSREELMDMEDELVDRFGDLPKEANNLLNIALLKSKASDVYITEIKGGMKGVRMKMDPHAPIDTSKIPLLVKEYRGQLKVHMEAIPYFTWVPEKKYVGNKGELQFLEDLMDLVDGFR
ncbi:MAG: transcription-repair coupling factor [Lachnospiraceae bacterium]|nr:transcription-repair coupling factor [Lachnospiraceae bacterium]